MKYASRASHLNKEHTRRDDMESWFFMIYEFFNKSLPWKSLSDKDKILESKTNFIMDFKFSDDISKKYGTEFTTICEYFGVQNFHEMEPDYDYFESAILDLLRSANKGVSKFQLQDNRIWYWKGKEFGWMKILESVLQRRSGNSFQVHYAIIDSAFFSFVKIIYDSLDFQGNDKLDWETTPGVFERATTQTEEGKKNAKAT